MSLSEAAPGGRLAGLVALRERLAMEIDQCDSSRDVAALSIRFMDVLEQIEELSAGDVDKPKTALDELRRRREARSKKTG